MREAALGRGEGRRDVDAGRPRVARAGECGPDRRRRGPVAVDDQAVADGHRRQGAPGQRDRPGGAGHVQAGEDRHGGGDRGGDGGLVAARVEAHPVLGRDGGPHALPVQFGVGGRRRGRAVAVAHQRDAHERGGDEQVHDGDERVHGRTA
jgi:hypothetical protein